MTKQERNTLDEPVFDAPWQAEAFALTVALNEAGHLEWSEWAQHLSQALRDAGQSDQSPLSVAHDSEGNDAYYKAWLVALERVVREKDWVGPLQLGARREAIRAYINVADSPSTLRVTDNDSAQSSD